MDRDRLILHGLRSCDYVMIAGVALVPILAWYGIRLVEIAGLVPLVLLAPWWWRRMRPDRSEWLMIALFAQYAALVSVNVLVYPLLQEDTSSRLDKAWLYIGAAIVLLLMVMRFRIAINPARVWRIVGPPAILASVAMLGWDLLRTGDCRVGAMSKFLLFPPMWLTVLAFASYHDWDRMSRRERALRHFTLAAVVLSTVGLSGARAMLLAQVALIPVLALILGGGTSMGRRLQVVAMLGFAWFAGFAGGLALDYQAGCGFAQRLVAIAETAGRHAEADALTSRGFAERLEAPAPSRSEDDTAEAHPEPTPAPEPTPVPTPPAEAEVGAPLERDEANIAGVYIRVVLWREALEVIRQAPLLGHGHMNERHLAVGNFPHFHQQYLSWLVWGGPLMLLSGLVMLFAPLATFGVRRSRNGAVMALAMVGPLAINFLTSTILLHTVMLLGYVITLPFLHTLARAEPRDPGPG